MLGDAQARSLMSLANFVDLSEQILRLHVLRHRWRGWHGLCGHRGSVERGACSRAGDALVLGGTNLNEVGCNGCRLKAISLRQIVGLS